jgi:hypothetical protein
MMIQYTKAFIQSLLDKYMEGMTTLEEEDILHQYFTRSDVPAEWEDYRMLFAEIDSMRPAEKPSHRWWSWRIAAAVVAVLVVLGITQNPQKNRPKPVVTAQVEEKEKLQQTHPQPLPCREGSRYFCMTWEKQLHIRQPRLTDMPYYGYMHGKTEKMQHLQNSICGSI